jgi:hypothetical protein
VVYAGPDFSASGGTSPYVFTISKGALPTGMSLASDGNLSGTPTVPGVYTFTVRATAKDLCFVSVEHTITVDELVVPGVFRAGTAQFSSNASGSASSISATMTMGTGTNRLAVVYAVGGTADTLTSCTYNGSAMTVADKVRTPSDLYVYALYLIAPATGANTLTCTWSANTAMAVQFQGYKGVHQTTPINAFANSTSSNTSAYTAQATTTQANTWTVVGHRSWTSSSAGVGSRLLIDTPGFGMGLYDFGPHETTGVKSMQVLFASATRYGAVILALNPAE